MGRVYVEGLKLYGFHGCNAEEAKTGTYFNLDIEVQTDLTKPSKTDSIEDAVSYARLCEIAKEEMQIRSNLLEHLATRIMNRIKADFKSLTYIKIKLGKHNAPVGMEVKSVGIVIEDFLK